MEMEDWERDEFQRRIETLQRKLEDAELSLHLLEDDRQMEYEAWAKREEYFTQRLELERKFQKYRLKFVEEQRDAQVKALKDANDALRAKWRIATERMRNKEMLVDKLKWNINSMRDTLRILGHRDDEETPK